MAAYAASEDFDRPMLHPKVTHRQHRPAPLAGDLRAAPSNIPYQSEREQRDSALQVAWSENIGEGEITSSLYLKVSVLLISWDVDCDDLKTKDEVSELEHVFKDIYHYKVEKAYLRCKANCPQAKKAQHQMQRHLANFIYEEDDQRTLLIVYYAGHGAPGTDPGHFLLAGSIVPTMGERESVKWHLTENSLLETTADVFVIFDCCYAGDASRTSGLGTRSFEFLAATSAGATTKSPGPGSFTSGLIWALTQMSQQEQTRFTTSELTNKIKQCPNFPRRQVPMLCERNAARIERILLAPLSANGANEDIEDQSASFPDTRELLNLQFVLDKYPDTEDVAKLAKGITNMVQYQDHLIRRVLWGGIRSASYPPPDINSLVLRAVQKFREAGEVGYRRRSINGMNDESTSATNTPNEQVLFVPSITHTTEGSTG